VELALVIENVRELKQSSPTTPDSPVLLGVSQGVSRSHGVAAHVKGDMGRSTLFEPGSFPLCDQPISAVGGAAPAAGLDRSGDQSYNISWCPPYLHTSKKRRCAAVIENLFLSLVVGDLNVCV
jgi:hypothetical protein